MLPVDFVAQQPAADSETPAEEGSPDKGVTSRSLILRHIWKKFFTTNSQIFKTANKKLG
jgi:hypothetical protein